MEFNKLKKLQSIIFPSVELPASEDMYFRGFERGVIVHLAKGVIDISARATVRSDTFFNGFSIGKWKKYCEFHDLHLAISGQGRVLIRIGLHALGHSQRWLHEEECSLSNAPSVVKIAEFHSLNDGILFFEIVALEDAMLMDGYYFTQTPPPNDVDLGIVVTHFNRRSYVLPTIQRIRHQLLQDPEIDDRISLIVVDNSQDISLEEAEGVTLIPNRNLGGSGGFMRGLLHLKDKCFSHCLFMDDDASFEIESIRRTFRILQYARSPSLAIAGSMLREAEPTQLHEAGATFCDGVIRPLKNGLKMHNVSELLLAEAELEKIDYGAWWHFAFRIDQLKHFAFPFFVRSDDILFSLMNEFDILTMNGIGVWGEDFSIKESPFTRYLGFRSGLVLSLLQSTRGASHFVRKYRRSVRKNLYSYNYSSARAVTLAAQHVIQGPDFWRRNIDMVAVLKELECVISEEKIEKVIFQGDMLIHNSRESPWRRLFRKMTLNGFLLPEGMIRENTINEEKSFNGDASKIFRFRRVRYSVSGGDLGYIAKHDKIRFWREHKLARKTERELRNRFKSLRDEYKKAFPELTSESFWREIYRRDE